VDAKNKYELVIGLEIHAQLLTKSKIFCSDSTQFGSTPNTQVGVVSLAHPGILPKLNRKAVEGAVKMGLVCQSEISKYNIFDRKNYFYPDLPKGYQLTQDRTPICKGGTISIKTKGGELFSVALNRIHLEEDAGKSFHPENESESLVDFNRAGVPLIEIVTEPCIPNAEIAADLLAEVRKTVRYLEICDGNMEEGSPRCDANVSIRLKGVDKLGSKAEVKNMNSVRNLQRAIEYEFIRQVEVLEFGGTIVSETRTFDADSGKTFGMRTKEELNDYRYFPDPDLSPLIISDEWLNDIKSAMPMLADAWKERLINEYGLPVYDAEVLTESKELVMYFEQVCQWTKNYKAVSNWLMGNVKSYLNENNLSILQFPIGANVLAEIINLIDSGNISHTAASKSLFNELIHSPERSVIELAQNLNLIQEKDSDALEEIVNGILNDFPDKVQEFKKGKKGLLGMFMGEVMKRSQGKADPKISNQLLLEKLS
jgi:aspartyl-tRNA(Asn)/glutamyl-tRNA(Gln) amidotransferase subunit B